MKGLELARHLVLSATQSVLEVNGQAEAAPELYSNAAGQELRGKLDDHLASSSPTVGRYVRRLGLDPLEYWVVMICAAVELHPELSAAFSVLEQSERARLPSATLVASTFQYVLDTPMREGLAAASRRGAPRRLGLVELADDGVGTPHTQRTLRLSPPELDILLADRRDATDSGLVHRRHEPAKAPIFEAKKTERAASLLEEHGGLCLRSRTPRVGLQFALDIAAVLERKAMTVRSGDEAANVRRSAVEEGAIPVVELGREDTSDTSRLLEFERLQAALPEAIFVVPPAFQRSALPVIDAPAMTRRERGRVWGEVVAEPMAARLAARFALTLPEARASVESARQTKRLENGDDCEPTETEVTHEVLEQGARRMGSSVSRLESKASLDRLVVPARIRRDIDAIIDWARVDEAVYEDWGMSADTRMGRGLACLFSGRPGTGKTFAAQCIANELGLNLYQIDLSQVVSKYIGETEKRLAGVFDEAEAGHGVLLFDEADALFGKRSEVDDAHDRYANIEVGYLLQRIETFQGMSILTTNLNSNIDRAFRRRLQFEIDFPLPDESMRRTLWEQSLPSQRRWADDVVLDELVSRFQLSGGHIHNIGLAAAHLAAASEEQRLEMRHIVAATDRELQKLGMPRTAEDFGSLASLLEEAA